MADAVIAGRCVKRGLSDALRQNARCGDCHGWTRTKDGSLAGPQSAGTLYRLFGAFGWRATPVFAPYAAIKTAGAVNELGVFMMTEQGCVKSATPSAIFLSRGDDPPVAQ